MAAFVMVAIASSGLWAGAAAAQGGGFGGGGLPTPLPINVESALIDGDFLLNGGSFGPDFFDGGQIRLVAEDGETLTIGNSWAHSYGPFQLIHGQYTPEFSSFFTPATAPKANGQAFSAPIVVEADGTFDLDVAAVPVQFLFSLDGASFPVTATDDATFYLRDSATGREVQIATIADASVSVNVVPGTYDVIYAHQNGALIPANEHAEILSDVTISAATTLVVDVPVALRSFFTLLNGASGAFNGLGYGNMSLENVETGDRVFIGRSNSPQFVRLIPGEYRVIYEGREFQGLAPRNRYAVAQESLTIAPTGTTSVFLDVITHLAEPEYFFNGSPASTSGLEYGNIEIEGSTGDRFQFGETNDTGEQIWLMEGTYNFYYEFREGANALPTNSNAQIAEGEVIDSSGPIALNIDSSVITVFAELNGAAFPASGLQYAYLRFVDTATGEVFNPGLTNDTPVMTRRLVHGTYDIVYSFREGPMFVPINQYRVVARDLVVDQSSSVVLDIQAQMVAPSFSLNGSPFPANASNYGELFLRDWEDESFSLGNTDATPDTRFLIEGAYIVEYEWRAGAAVPQNGVKAVQIATVPEPSTSMGLMLGALILVMVRGEPPRGCRTM